MSLTAYIYRVEHNPIAGHHSSEEYVVLTHMGMLSHVNQAAPHIEHGRGHPRLRSYLHTKKSEVHGTDAAVGEKGGLQVREDRVNQQSIDQPSAQEKKWSRVQFVRCQGSASEHPFANDHHE